MPENITTGQSFRASMKIDAAILDQFAELSGDENPIHLDVEEAKAYGFPRRVAHGALLVALLSRNIG